MYFIFISFKYKKDAHPLNPLSACAWLSDSNLITSSQDCCLRKWKINAINAWQPFMPNDVACLKYF